MPRGVPKAGYRNTKNRRIAAVTTSVPNTFESVETYEQAEARIRERFEVLDEFVQDSINGDVTSLIVSGPGGLGKSYRAHKALKAWDCNKQKHSVTKGYCKATGLYRLLWKHRHPGQVICFDDCDTVLFDETSLNFLKAACDTSAERIVSYSAEYDMFDEEGGENIPREFQFEGTIIFISNIDWDAQVDKGSKLAPHLGAMISRSHYIDLGLKTKRDLLIRIKHVIEDGALDEMELSAEEQDDVVGFINENADRLRELSVRILLKVATLRKVNPKWERAAKVSCCR